MCNVFLPCLCDLLLELNNSLIVMTSIDLMEVFAPPLVQGSDKAIGAYIGL